MRFKDLFKRKKKDVKIPAGAQTPPSTQSLVVPPSLPGSPPSVVVMTNELQKEIQKIPPGGVLTLDASRGEYQGPITISQPLIIEGKGHSIWAKKGPVVIIESRDVILKNLQVEVTGNEKKLSDVELCSLAVHPDAYPDLESVTVRGDVVGLPGEEGVWAYPTSLHLGVLKANIKHEFRVQFAFPVECRLECDVAGVTVGPSVSAGGKIENIKISVDPLPLGTRLRGSLYIKSGTLIRRIALGASVDKIENANAVVGTGQTLWIPKPEVLSDDEVERSSSQTTTVKTKKKKTKKTSKKKTQKQKSQVTKKTAKKTGATKKAAKTSAGKIPARMPAAKRIPTKKPIVPDQGNQAFKPKRKTAQSTKSQTKKSKSINKKSGIPSGAFATTLEGGRDLEKTKSVQPSKKKNTASPTAPKKKVSKTTTKKKVSHQNKTTRKFSPSKGGYEGGAFSVKSVEPSMENKPAAKKLTTKKSAKHDSKKNAHSSVKHPATKRIQSKGLGSVWGDTKGKS